nr:unnamed protein product [Callosobruchus analis]
MQHKYRQMLLHNRLSQKLSWRVYSKT